MSGWSWASNRKIRNGPYMAGCSPAVNGSTCTVMFGRLAASMSLSIWARMTSGPVVAAGRRSGVSSSTSQSRGGGGAAQRVPPRPRPGRGGAGGGGDVRAGQPQLAPPLDFFLGGVGEASLDAGASVLRGLQQPRDPVRIVTADQGGGFFQADERAEPGRQHVVVAVPPAGLAGVAG